MVESRIPGHITGLYIFAVVNLCALLNISLVSAEVFVIDTEKNSTLATIEDKQAMFGPDFPDQGFVGRLVYVVPHNACDSVSPPPGESDLPWIALIKRERCHFDQKVLNAQKAGYSAAIVHNYEGNESIMPMGGDSAYADKVHIPSVFVGYTSGMTLAKEYNYTHKAVVIRIEEYNDEPPTSFFLPFVIVVSICFFGVVIFSIIKCIKYFQHVRRTRLSKSALRKIPTQKYKKGDHYDTCAICLEDYEEGEKLRVLPCNHTYHCKCIDPWLTKRKKTCPQCKRRVIPGQDTDSETEGEEEGASESTPLLGNNNNRRSGPTRTSASRQTRPASRTSRARTSTFDRSGLPAAVQPDVVVVNQGQTEDSAAVVVMDHTDNSDSDQEEEGEELEGAVGGVGISDRKDFEEDFDNVIVEVEPARHSPLSSLSRIPCEPAVEAADLSPATEQAPEDVYSLVGAEGSVNGAFSTSGSSEDDSSSGGNTDGSSGRREKKKSPCKNNQVV